MHSSPLSHTVSVAKQGVVSHYDRIYFQCDRIFGDRSYALFMVPMLLALDSDWRAESRCMHTSDPPLDLPPDLEGKTSRVGRRRKAFP